MACHDVPPFTDAQVAWLDARYRPQAPLIFSTDRHVTDDERARIVSAMREAIRHCSACGTSPLSRVVACTSTDCPAREAQAA